MNLRQVFSTHFTLSKRLLGLLMILVGAAGIAGILMIDVLEVGRQGGIGPSQRIALGGCITVIIVGLTLVPLGNNPA